MTSPHLTAQPSSSTAFMINKTHVVTQKPRGRQLNTKVCGSESAIFYLTSVKKRVYASWVYFGMLYEFTSSVVI